MSVISDAAVSRGDLSKRLDELEARLDRVETARRAEATAVGRNGVRVHSGGSVRLAGGGSLLVDDGGDVRVTGGQIVIQDPSGTETFLAGTDGLSLTGLLQVLGGGDIRVAGGRLQAVDSNGDDVFVVGTDPASIFMREELIEELSARVFANRVHSVDEDAQVSIAHTAFNFVSAAGGPTLTDVPITSAGRAIVFASANIGTDTAAAGTEVRGFMSYEVSGASAVAPVTRNAVQLDFRNDTDDNGAGISASRASLLTGLNEGLHDFEAKYQVTAFGAGDEAIFLFRNLTVIAF